MSGHALSNLAKRPTFVASDRALARYFARPVLRFIDTEVASGILLLIATAVALTWANIGDSYNDFWHTEMLLEIGSWEAEMSLAHFVNDGLMALFFFVVGLEIKRELVVGRLADPRVAALPGIAALGGMIVPAGFFALANLGGDGMAGWGIPMATDIAFALGVVALLGSRVSAELKLFLLTLAIVDDIGAIAVIAIFYSTGLDFAWLALAVAGLAMTRALTIARVWAMPVYVLLGTFIWYATWQSGVHATIAGVALGLLTPALPLLSREEAEDVAEDLPDDPSAEEIRQAAFLLRNNVGVCQWLETHLHPFTSFLIIPIFALANAGIEISGDALSNAASSKVTIGIILGLVLGKPVGIMLFTWLATRMNFDLPPGVRWAQFLGMGLAAGIGFTVSIFISGLAYTGDDVVQLVPEAKIGILVASAIAAVGALIALRSTRDPA
ncbi:MAG: Na+/H+ antiporter NhaA [Actinomycetia bacterium]|nr:Na+/H+ antiporter NhaA [Actinomycetes bacterium]